jgi:hypothetical protein
MKLLQAIFNNTPHYTRFVVGMHQLVNGGVPQISEKKISCRNLIVKNYKRRSHYLQHEFNKITPAPFSIFLF